MELSGVSCFHFVKVEENLLLKRAKGKTFSDGVYEFSNSTRRSFLKKIRGAEQSSSKQGLEDCRELAVYSDVESLLSHSDNERLNSHQACSYLRVERRNFTSVRPVLIVGPFSQCILEKLSSDHPSKFVLCQPEYMNSDLRTVEKGVSDNIFIDFKRRGSHFECTTFRSVKDIINNNQHSLLGKD